jgi:hypothetical protein
LQLGTDHVEPAVAAAYNNLLTWLSAAGTGRWETFLRICQELGLAQDARYARHLIRRLTLLGHLTLTEGGDRWAMQPPTLAPLAVDPELFILRGQRTAEVMARLPENRESTPQGGAPDRVICCVPLEHGTPSISVAGVTFRNDQSAVNRAQSLPDWRSWVTTMRRYDGRDLGKFTYTERWDNGEWVGSPLFFDDTTKRIVGPTGMYRLSRDGRNAQARSPLIALFDVERQVIVRGDWYGLRFLAARAVGEQACATWDLGSRTLFVQVAERWPLLYEQALVQASGLLPGRSASWLFYHEIPQDLAESLCGKLDVTLQVVASPVSPECERAAILSRRTVNVGLGRFL